MVNHFCTLPRKPHTYTYKIIDNILVDNGPSTHFQGIIENQLTYYIGVYDIARLVFRLYNSCYHNKTRKSKTSKIEN